MIYSLTKTILTGTFIAIAETSFSLTAQKICLLSGIRFTRIPEEDGLSPREVLDKDFLVSVIFCPILEELIFGVLQYFLSHCFAKIAGKLDDRFSLEKSNAERIACLSIAALFAILHRGNYKEGGHAFSIIATISGTIFGITRKNLGIATSVIAHILHNLTIAVIDQYDPDFLESPT